MKQEHSNYLVHTEGSPGKNMPGRNESCYCGSGKKFKKCHGVYNLHQIEVLKKHQQLLQKKRQVTSVLEELKNNMDREETEC